MVSTSGTEIVENTSSRRFQQSAYGHPLLLPHVTYHHKRCFQNPMFHFNKLWGYACMTIGHGTRTNLPHGSPSIKYTAISKIFEQRKKSSLIWHVNKQRHISCYINNVCMIVILTSVAITHGHKRDVTESRMLPGRYGSMRKCQVSIRN
jgi:hypothetical protein